MECKGTPIHLYSVFGFSHATTVELTNWNKECMTYKPKVFTVCPST